MKVLHVIPSAAPVDGGPNLAVRAMARGLVARGIDVTVATTNASGTESLDVPLDDAVLESGVVYRYFARTVPGSWKFSWPLTRWLWRNVATYDVVHVHALFSYATIPGCRAAAHAPVPYVLRPLGTLSEWSLGRRAWKKRPYYSLLERSHLEMASAIHVTSAAEARDVQRLGYGERARVIPLGVDVPERPTTRADHALGNRPLRLLFLSRLHEKKNVPLLLRALAAAHVASPMVHLTVAGTGDAAYVEELTRLTRTLGLEGRVTFAGHVEGDAKRRAFADADCFVLPSAHENFGLAVAEALAAGLPVIVTPGVALAANVNAAGAGIVASASEEGVAAAISWFAHNPRALGEMGDRAWQLARRELSWERSCASLIDLYRDLVTTPGYRVGKPA